MIRWARTKLFGRFFEDRSAHRIQVRGGSARIRAIAPIRRGVQSHVDFVQACALLDLYEGCREGVISPSDIDG
jgi:hypothetical protein